VRKSKSNEENVVGNFSMLSYFFLREGGRQEPLLKDEIKDPEVEVPVEKQPKAEQTEKLPRTDKPSKIDTAILLLLLLRVPPKPPQMRFILNKIPFYADVNWRDAGNRAICIQLVSYFLQICAVVYLVVRLIK